MAKPNVTLKLSGMKLAAVANIALGAGSDASANSLPRFSMIAYTGVPLHVAGWRYPVIIDLAGLTIPSQSRPIRFGHDPSAGVGHTDSIRVEDGQLVATGVISRDTAAAKEVVASARNGFPWQASVGITVDEYERCKEGQVVVVNGRQYAGPLDVVRKATLAEISFVDLGADDHTSATIAASADMPSDQEASSSDTLNLGLDTQRVLALRRVFGGEMPELEMRAIEEGWDVSRAAVEFIRASRPQVSVRMCDTGADRWERVAVAALAARGGIAPPEHLRDEAKRWQMAPFSAIAKQCLVAEGQNIPLHATPRQLVEAAFSTRSLSNILKDAAQKLLLAGYESVDRASLRVSKVLEATDFKTHTLARLTGQYRFERVASDGELPHATVSDQGYTIKVETYGRLVGLTRQDLINDDLGAFLDMPRQLGRGAALALESAFWSMVEAANGTFFASGNNNVISGSGSAFGVSGLNSAIAKLRKQKDADNNPIKARPRWVVVPPDLEADATQIYTSNVLLIAGSTDRAIAANNPHANKYEPVVSEYLTSSSVWYLVADPEDVPAFGVAFLRGQQAPAIEETEPDPKYLGTLWRGYFDFGVATLDPRGAVRAAGA